jgi:hypothetical protein
MERDFKKHYVHSAPYRVAGFIVRRLSVLVMSNSMADYNPIAPVELPSSNIKMEIDCKSNVNPVSSFFLNKENNSQSKVILQMSPTVFSNFSGEDSGESNEKKEPRRLGKIVVMKSGKVLLVVEKDETTLEYEVCEL